MMKWYTLDENNIPVECSMEEARTIRVGYTRFDDDTELSTIFIGVLKPTWETAYLAYKDTDVLERYGSYEEAVEGHRRHYERIKEGKDA